MYSKQEASLLNQQFWTSFGMYMSPVLSAEGEKINWVNYKTGQKDIRFTMTAQQNAARVSVQLSHKDVGEQQEYFEKFTQLKKAFDHVTGVAWEWRLHGTDVYGKTVSKIYIEIGEVNVLNKADWPAIISFFKEKLIALDAFWCEYKYAFE